MEILGIDAKDFKPHFDEFAGRLHPDDKDCTLMAVENHLHKKAPMMLNIDCDITKAIMYGFMPRGRRFGMRAVSRCAWWVP